ncbi:MAG: prolyl oligopeptidase family serine peptidase [Phycisphaerales bacterium]|nr:prolyl oligopeptidase family serine peptidase [Phycisphaerales bacterium]
MTIIVPLVALLIALPYPATPRGDVVETHHGVLVEDPYRWLEGDVRTHDEVSDWVDAQNVVTQAYLGAIPSRQTIRDRVEEVWNYEKSSAPFRVGDRYYFTRNDGLQNQPVWYVQDALDGPAQVLLDPNTWSEDGTVALRGSGFSRDGQYMAYGISEGGSDWVTWKVRDLKTNTDLAETIRWSKFSPAAWMPDGSGFFYSRFAEPQTGQAMQDANRNQTMWFHRPGTPQSEDVLVHADPEHPDWGWSPQVTEDGRWLVVNVWRGGAEDRVMVQDLRQTGSALEPIIEEFEDEWSLVGSEGPLLYFRTTKDAPRGRLVSIDMSDPKRSMREVIPQSDDQLRGVSLVGGHFVTNRLHHATSLVQIYDTQGRLQRTLQQPGPGTVSGFGGWEDDPETFYTWTSYTSAPQIFRYDVSTGESTPWWQADVAFDPDKYIATQVFVTSKDGTQVPMMIVRRSDITANGQRPTLLYGYGGFNIPLLPVFSASRLVWMEMGGVMAVANLRGGGEYGRDWHLDGTKLKKQNVFDDFIACAEWLIEHDWTRPSRLAIQGGSNGGLLVGAAMTQRPELFGACLPAVGVMDMLRYPEFTIGRAWVPDYGDPKVEEEFRALHAYSPYHNLKVGTRYPATMVTTADTDDRVVPGHSFKYAAALQHAQSDEAGAPPVLIRVDRKAGHGAGKPTSMRMDEVADTWAFLIKSLDAPVSVETPAH